MAHKLIKLRVLDGFVDAGNLTPVSLSKGDIIERDEEIADRWIDAGRVEEILSPIDQMVQIAHDIGGVAFVTDNAEVASACAEAGVGCVPTGKGKK